MKVNDENSRIRIRIHPKISWIRNTVRDELASKDEELEFLREELHTKTEELEEVRICYFCCFGSVNLHLIWNVLPVWKLPLKSKNSKYNCTLCF
jgi:hypothetical protein